MICGVLCTQGEMSLGEVLRECRNDCWVPLLVMRPDEGPPVVPVFPLEETARDFARRNLPKKWVHGAVALTDRDLEWMDSKGWDVVRYDFPRKLKDVVEFDIEILEFDEPPEVRFKK
jgi:hypothetical protein